jgi:hypothetical protein
MSAEHPAVVGDRTHQECRGHSSADQADLIESTARPVEPAEANREWEAEQESEEHLHAETGHAQLLEQVAQIAIVPFPL